MKGKVAPDPWGVLLRIESECIGEGFILTTAETVTDLSFGCNCTAQNEPSSKNKYSTSRQKTANRK